MDRPTIDQYFMKLATVVSERSTWPGTKVGCVLVQDRQIVSGGYNGSPRGYTNDLQKSDKQYFCHAEENAIVQAARVGTRILGATAYCSLSPCMACARMMVNAGVVRLVYSELWDDASPLTLLSQCGVELVALEK